MNEKLKSVFIDNINFTNLGIIKSDIGIIEQKDFDNRIYINNFSFDCWNGEDVNYILSFDNPNGLFSGRNNIENSKVEIYDEDNNLIWEGNVKQIERDYETLSATINCSSQLEKLLEQKVFYYNTTLKTPALIAKEILIGYGLSDFIGLTFDYSDNFLQSNNIYVKCSFNEEDSIFDVLNLLAKISHSDCYSTKNKIEFKTYDSSLVNVNSNFLIEEKHISNLRIFEDTDNIFNNYNIKTDLGILSYTGSNNDILQSQIKYGIRVLDNIDFSVDSNIISSDIVMAGIIGESYISRYKNPLKIIECNIDKETFGKYLDLNMYVQIENIYEDLSSYIFEIIEIEDNNDLYYSIRLKEIKRI